MSGETPNKADYSAIDTAIVERTEDQWRDQFRTLFRNKLGSIFEIARQITLFHEQVNKNPERWRGGWKPDCKRVVGIGHSTASQYETIHKVFSVSTVLADNRDKLPIRSHTLYLIARVFEKHEPTVSEAIQVRLIHPDMTQAEGRQLLDLADDNFRRESREPGPFEEAKPATAAGGDTEATNADEAAAATETAAPKKGRQGGKKEAEAKDDDEQDEEELDEYERPKSAFGPPPPPPRLNVNAEIRKIAEEFGELYDERIVRHILTWRADHPRIFAAIAQWDARFGPMAVTLALRQLGYQPNIETMIF
jgi:hypothetical protein